MALIGGPRVGGTRMGMGAPQGNLDYYLNKFKPFFDTRTGTDTGGAGRTGFPDIQRPHVQMPGAGDFGMPSREGLNETLGDVRTFRGGFLDPTHTGAFRNIMSLAGERTATAAEAASRDARRATAARGYAGGFEDVARQSARDRMRAVAETGFAAAQGVQEQYGEQYRAALPAYTSLVGGYNQQMAQRNLAVGQAMQDARIKQAELDSAFNSQLIDRARYEQMSRSLEETTRSRVAALAEQAREFDISQGFEERQAGLAAQQAAQTRQDQLERERLAREQSEAERQRQYVAQGRNPLTGQGYGMANPAPAPRGFGGINRGY